MRDSYYNVLTIKTVYYTIWSQKTSKQFSKGDGQNKEIKKFIHIKNPKHVGFCNYHSMFSILTSTLTVFLSFPEGMGRE